MVEIIHMWISSENQKGVWKSGIPESSNEENRTGKDGVSGRIPFPGVSGSRADVCSEAESGEKEQPDFVRHGGF